MLSKRFLERAKGHRGDRKAPISNRRQGRKALTGETSRPPSSREGDRPQAVEGVSASRARRHSALSRRFLYNPGCRVATLLVSMGVMGFLGDLRGRNSKSPPNPLGLAERVPSSADDDSPVFRNLVRGTNSFHRLRAVPLPRGGRSGGAGERLNQIPSHMPDMRRVRRAYDFFCFRRIGVGRPNWPNGGFSARMTCPRPIRRRTDCSIIGV